MKYDITQQPAFGGLLVFFKNWQGGISPARYALVCPTYSSPDSTNENELPEIKRSLRIAPTCPLMTRLILFLNVSKLQKQKG